MPKCMRRPRLNMYAILYENFVNFIQFKLKLFSSRRIQCRLSNIYVVDVKTATRETKKERKKLEKFIKEWKTKKEIYKLQITKLF